MWNSTPVPEPPWEHQAESLAEPPAQRVASEELPVREVVLAVVVAQMAVPAWHQLDEPLAAAECLCW